MPTPSRLQDLLSPCLLIHLDRVQANLDCMEAHLEGQWRRWRPHLKTTKIPQIWAQLRARGVTRFKCATLREAECLLALPGREEIHLLVAMPLRGPNLARLGHLAGEMPETRLAVLTEDPEHAAHVALQWPQLGLFVDLNPGFHRTGIPLGDRDRLEATVAACGSSLQGLHFYEGQLRHLDPDRRRREAESLYAQFAQVYRTLKAPDSQPLECITSGTPTFAFALKSRFLAGLDHSVSPGTVVYWDRTSEAFGLPGFQFAATVLSRVLSRPFPGRITLDAGSKALDAACGDPCAEVEERPHWQILRPSEEHLPVAVPPGEEPAAGSLWQLRPTHVCPTVNLADQAVVLDRGEVLNILPVVARAHDCGLWPKLAQTIGG